MSDVERDALIHDLFFAESRMERLKAESNLRFAREIGFRDLFKGFMDYIAALLTGTCAPRENHVTPFMMFHDAFEPLLYLLWTAFDDSEPAIRALSEMQADDDPRVSALATISLAVGNAHWHDARVEIILQTAPRVTPLQNAAANLAHEYLPFSRCVQAATAPDMALTQRLEQYAAQVMSGLVHSSIIGI